MVTRRILVQAGLKTGLGVLCAKLAAFAESEAATVQSVFQQSLPAVALDNWTVTVVEVDYPPGAASAPHRHPGFVLGYVLEGEVRSGLRGQPERIYAAGEMFYEPPHSEHLVSANASKDRRARLLALIFAEKGSTLSIPL
jgi:quercetin dioxygenase-like cupin family protein